MSYWIYLADDNGIVSVDRHTEGGTYAIGGIDVAELNVTYNYSKFFSFRSLDGKVASTTVEEMQGIVDRLGTERSPDYWEPTEGNAGHAVSILLDWAKQHPFAIWRVS